MQDDPTLERRQPEGGDEELADHDQRHHPAWNDVLIHQHHEDGKDQDLVGRWIEEGSERGGSAAAARDSSIEPVRRHRGREESGSPVVVPVEAPGIEQHDERNRGGARDR